MAIIYESEYLYVQSATDIADKINKIEAVITALEDSALKSAGSANIESYDLDDGQTKIKTSYRSPKAISEAIDTYERIKNRLINQLQGRQIALRDAGSNILYP